MRKNIAERIANAVFLRIRVDLHRSPADPALWFRYEQHRLEQSKLD